MICCFHDCSRLVCASVNASWFTHFSTRPRNAVTHSSSGLTLTSNCVHTFPMTLVNCEGRSSSGMELPPSPSTAGLEASHRSSFKASLSSPLSEHAEEEEEVGSEDADEVVVVVVIEEEQDEDVEEKVEVEVGVEEEEDEEEAGGREEDREDEEEVVGSGGGVDWE